MTARSLLTAVVAGRATFLIAGAALGIGAYGFMITLDPYRSERVLEPLPNLHVPILNAAHVSAQEVDVPEALPPATLEAATPSSEPAVVVTATPRPAPEPPPVHVTGTGEDVAPLDPPEPRRGIGPVIIDPEFASVQDIPAPRQADLGVSPTPTPTPSPAPHPTPAPSGDTTDDSSQPGKHGATPGKGDDNHGQGNKYGHDKQSGSQNSSAASPGRSNTGKAKGKD